MAAVSNTNIAIDLKSLIGGHQGNSVHPLTQILSI